MLGEKTERFPEVICFGEILFDVFKDKKLPGGAPFNVAAHLTQLGISTGIISKVGNDELGKELLRFAELNKVSTHFVQEDQTHPTGTVLVEKDEKMDSVYTINHPVAWDNIELIETMVDAVERVDYFVFGSLCARSETSRNTLLRLLDKASKKVFDINLRAPHYDLSFILKVLPKCNIVKVNEEELEELLMELEVNEGDISTKMKVFYEKFNLDILLVTRGANGACMYNSSGYFTHSGFKVQAIDTTGSGDSFLATAISSIKRDLPPEETLGSACRIGSFVATQKGAIPKITISIDNSF